MIAAEQIKAETMPPQVKGFAIRGLLKFVKQSGYPGGIPAMISLLPSEDQKTFADPINASAWYPYTVFAHLLRAINQSMGKGDLSAARRIGEAAAQWDVQGVFKIIGALTGLQTLLPRARIFWPRYFSAGTLVVTDIGDRGARLQIQNFPEIDPVHCVVLEGWFEELSRLFGAKNVRVTHTACVHKRGAVCEYTLTYS